MENAIEIQEKIAQQQRFFFFFKQNQFKGEKKNPYMLEQRNKSVCRNDYMQFIYDIDLYYIQPQEQTP